jgi:small subunit ribosomal protein S9
MAEIQQYWGTGRRKTAVARVRLLEGRGNIVVNGETLDSYFPEKQQVETVRAPMVATETLDRYDVIAKVKGGGYSGQAGAFLLGIARALKKADASLDEILREGNFLTRDPRMVERKKYGRHKARRGHQFSKR